VTERLDPEYLIDDPETKLPRSRTCGWTCRAGCRRWLSWPMHSFRFRSANAGSYRTERGRLPEASSSELDDYARKSIESIPEPQRVLVTAHDAFSYMGRAYGIEVKGIQGISTESEAGLKDINRLVSELVDRKIPAVFVETSVSDKNVKALIEGAAARGHQVAVGGELFSDAMGPAGTYEGTYVGMIDTTSPSSPARWAGRRPPKACRASFPAATDTRPEAICLSRIQRHADAGDDMNANPTHAATDAQERQPALWINDLTVAYHRKPVLWDVDLSLPDKRLIAIVGPNGAGKSTLIKAVLDLVPRAVRHGQHFRGGL
jgi:hypothetical protein